MGGFKPQKISLGCFTDRYICTIQLQYNLPSGGVTYCIQNFRAQNSLLTYVSTEYPGDEIGRQKSNAEQEIFLDFFYIYLGGSSAVSRVQYSN